MAVKIPLMKVHVPPKTKLMPALQEVLYSGMLTEGAKVKEFEEKFKENFNLHVRPLTTNSCTSALQLAYRVSKTDKKKIVLATPMTCTATNMPIFSEGMQLVWCDIDPETGNICAGDVQEKIERYGHENIAAVSFVDFAGYPAHLDKLNKTVNNYPNRPVLIEDAAQSLGAKWNNDYVGSHKMVDFVAYSFQAIKHLTTADGGALVCNGWADSISKWELAKRLKWYGINREAVKEATRWHYDIPDWGYKAHMNNVNATIGLIQLDYIDKVIKRHKENGRFFDEKLKKVEGVAQMKIPEGSEPSYWIYMIKVEDRESFAQAMLDAGIGVNVAHIRNDQYTCFQDHNLVLNHWEDRPGLEEFNDKYIAIPCGWWVTDEDREYIVETIKKGW